jgi:hypothetical protein
MIENPHFKELLQRFYANSVRYLIVGGYAVMKYSEPRFTKDLDVWVGNDSNNADRVYRSLAEFGAPLQSDNLLPEDFAREDITYQIGMPPIRIDILTHIDGVAFCDAWPNRVESKLFETTVFFISLDDLILNKESTGRSSDLDHLKSIRETRE